MISRLRIGGALGLIYPRIFAGYQPMSRRLWHIWEHIAAAAAEVYPTMRKIVGGPGTTERSILLDICCCNDALLQHMSKSIER